MLEQGNRGLLVSVFVYKLLLTLSVAVKRILDGST